MVQIEIKNVVEFKNFKHGQIGEILVGPETGSIVQNVNGELIVIGGCKVFVEPSYNLQIRVLPNGTKLTITNNE